MVYTCPGGGPLVTGVLSPAAAGRWGMAAAGVGRLPRWEESRPHSWG